MTAVFRCLYRPRRDTARAAAAQRVGAVTPAACAAAFLSVAAAASTLGVGAGTAVVQSVAMAAARVGVVVPTASAAARAAAPSAIASGWALGSPELHRD